MELPYGKQEKYRRSMSGVIVYQISRPLNCHRPPRDLPLVPMISHKALEYITQWLVRVW